MDGGVSFSNPNARESVAIHPAYDSHVAAVCRLTDPRPGLRTVRVPPLAPQNHGTTICAKGLAPSAATLKGTS